MSALSLRAALEREAVDHDGLPAMFAGNIIALSQAISLKRIADALERSSRPMSDLRDEMRAKAAGGK